MKQTTADMIIRLFDKIMKKEIDIVYGSLPNYIYTYVDNGRDYKRIAKYDEAVEMYIQAISTCGCLYTEVGRMFAKTLCAMNEYLHALIILHACASVKWEDQLSFNKTGNSVLDEAMQNYYGGKPMPTACATDFYILRDGIVDASKGNLKPLKERTKEVSGNPNYSFEKSDKEIIDACIYICKATKSS